MNQDIIKMAKECGFDWFHEFPVSYQVKFERFFHMAQADMKEKCAKFLEETDICGDAVVDELAAAIRAIGDSHDQT